MITDFVQGKGADEETKLCKKAPSQREDALKNAGMSSINVEVVQDPDALAAILPEWDRVWAADPYADLFSGSEWFMAWWSSFAASTESLPLHVTCGYQVIHFPAKNPRLHVLVVRDGDECIAVLPLVSFYGAWRSCPAKILLSPLNGQSWRSNIVISRGAERVFDAVLAHLRSNRSWDILLLDGTSSASGTAEYFRRSALAQGLPVSDKDFPWRHLYVSVSGTWEEYLAAKGKHFRKHLRQSEGYLAQLGALSFERYGEADPEETGLKIFLEIDQHSWKAVRGESVAAIPALRNFYINLFRKLNAQGRCEIWVLRIADEPVSAVFCIKSQGVLYAYKTSSKEQYTSAKLSPGVILLTHLIKYSHDSGFAEVDFLGDLPIIRRWTSSAREFDRVCVFGGHGYGRVLYYVDCTARRLRILGSKLKAWLQSRRRPAKAV